jgi:hypothetical protein
VNTYVLLSAITLVGLLALAVMAARIFGCSPHFGSTSAQGILPAYEAIPTLLTPAERSFFGVLHQALAPDYHLFVKVRLADIVRPVQEPSRSGRQAAFNRISSKHVDFVLCDLAHLKVIGVIELDDSTHERFERGIRDSFVDSALTKAGIPVLRFSARHSYLLAEIREQARRAFGSEQKAA